MIAKKLRGRLSWRPSLDYVYFEDEPGRRSAAKLALLSKSRRWYLPTNPVTGSSLFSKIIFKSA
jgi:hypothetical protein